MTIAPLGAISSKMLQLESMLAHSATFRAAIGSAVNCEEAKERIYYSYSVLGDDGSDPLANLDKLIDKLPFAVIFPCEQFAYGLVAAGAKHYLRAEGALGLVLLFRDEVTGHDTIKCKEREIAMSNFHGSVIDEVVALAGGENYAPIDGITLDVPPFRTSPMLDGAADVARGEFVPYFTVGYTLHWK